MQKLYLCRHGETEWTLTGQHTGKSDIALTKKGQEQAQVLRENLKNISFAKIFCSPSQRAIATAGEFSFALDENLAEWDYGDFEGKTKEEIQKYLPNWNLFRDGAPNGESVLAVSKRAHSFLQKISSFDGNIAIFSHGHFLRVLAASYLGIDLPLAQRLFLSVASLSILGEDRKERVIFLWNQTF